MDRPVGLTGLELTWLLSFLGLKTRRAVGQGQTMVPVMPSVDGETPTSETRGGANGWTRVVLGKLHGLLELFSG